MTDQENETDSELFEYACPRCHGGKRRLQHITYLTWFRDQMITVPNFPAWVCDLCGSRDFDTRAISWLNTILDQQDRSRSERPRPRQGPPTGAV